MSDSRASTTDEKVAISDEKGTTAHRDNSSKGFFSRRKSQLPVDEKDETEKNGDVTTEVTPAERVVPPISFTQLFRYPFSLPECLWILTHFFFSFSFSTPFELFIDVIGIVAAMAAGAAQVNTRLISFANRSLMFCPSLSCHFCLVT